MTNKKHEDEELAFSVVIPPNTNVLRQWGGGGASLGSAQSFLITKNGAGIRDGLSTQIHVVFTTRFSHLFRLVLRPSLYPVIYTCPVFALTLKLCIYTQKILLGRTFFLGWDLYFAKGWGPGNPLSKFLA